MCAISLFACTYRLPLKMLVKRIIYHISYMIGEILIPLSIYNNFHILKSELWLSNWIVFLASEKWKEFRNVVFHIFSEENVEKNFRSIMIDIEIIQILFPFLEPTRCYSLLELCGKWISNEYRYSWAYNWIHQCTILHPVK